MKKIFLLICVVFTGFNIHAQDLSAYQKKWFVQGSDTMPYRILLPLNYDALKKYPVVFFLHGSGERGNDNKKQLVHGADLFLKDDVRKNYPAIIIFPQCPDPGYWANVLRDIDSAGKTHYVFVPGGEPTVAMRTLQGLLKYVLETYPVKKDQVYIGGLSMGGMGTFELVRRNPGIFAAAFPICGGADPSTAKSLQHVNWWVFHGGKDDVILPAFSQTMVDALRKENISVKFSLYPEANHNSWDSAFAEPGLLPWLFAQHKK